MNMKLKKSKKTFFKGPDLGKRRLPLVPISNFLLFVLFLVLKKIQEAFIVGFCVILCCVYCNGPFNMLKPQLESLVNWPVREWGGGRG